MGETRKEIKGKGREKKEYRKKMERNFKKGKKREVRKRKRRKERGRSQGLRRLRCCRAACSSLGGRGVPRQSEGQVSIVPYKEGDGPPFHPFFLPGHSQGISDLVNTGHFGTLKKKKKKKGQAPPSFLYWGRAPRTGEAAAHKEVN